MSEMSWIGRTLSGRYKIEEMLGQGGMSAVYRAQDPNLRRVVAVKLIHAHLSDNPDFVRRFEEEATAVARLRHNNIIQVFDFSQDGSTFYIIFEFIPGETLQDWLSRLKKEDRLLPIEDVIRITATIADALEFAHQQGLIHRDVKPANVMINVRGEPILMDFGIAKIVGGTQHTATGAVLGTARYMSPEQIKGTRIDARTDLYSLGIMLFEMLSGRTPYESESVMTMMMMHVQDPVPNVQDVRPDTPPHLVEVVNRALAKDPAQRYPTARAMADALRQRAPAQAAPTLIVPDADEATMMASTPYAETIVADSGGRMQTSPTMPSVPPASTSAQKGGGMGRYLAIGGGLMGLLLLLAGLFYAFVVVPGQGEDNLGVNGEALIATAVAEEEALIATALAEEEALTTPTATVEVVADLTPVSTPFPEVRISNVTQVSDVYVVQYETISFVEEENGLHLHFFFDTTPARDAGRPASDFFMYLGPSPYAELRLSDRPQGARQICALVANPDHTVQGESGNCFDLPEPVNESIPSTAQPDTAITNTPPSPTTQPNPTATNVPPPPPPPSPTAAAPPTAVGNSVNISNISVQDGVYIVTYSTSGFTEQLPGQHIHFFFNTVAPENAGLPANGPWTVWGGPRPFNGYRVNDRPAGATQLCALVANPDHTVQLGTGNCVNLPGY